MALAQILPLISMAISVLSVLLVLRAQSRTAKKITVDSMEDRLAQMEARARGCEEEREQYARENIRLMKLLVKQGNGG